MKKLTAIITAEGFAGVVPSNQVGEIAAEAGLKDFVTVEDVKVAKKAPQGSEIIYEAAWDELIDDLNGGMGKVVYKCNHGSSTHHLKTAFDVGEELHFDALNGEEFDY